MTTGRGATGLPLTSFAMQMISDAKFRELWRVPVLVWESAERDAEDAGAPSPIAAPTRPRAGEPLLFEARRAPDSKTAVLGIALGSTGNNDIVINDPSVSPFHAVLLKDEKSGEWTLGDAGSSNGTLVRGARLKPLVSVPLGEDELIVLGSVPLRFLSPPAFFRYIEAMMTTPPPKRA